MRILQCKAFQQIAKAQNFSFKPRQARSQVRYLEFNRRRGISMGDMVDIGQWATPVSAYLINAQCGLVNLKIAGMDPTR